MTNKTTANTIDHVASLQLNVMRNKTRCQLCDEMSHMYSRAIDDAIDNVIKEEYTKRNEDCMKLNQLLRQESDIFNIKMIELVCGSNQKTESLL